MNGAGVFGGNKGVDNGRGRKGGVAFFVDTLGTCRETIYVSFGGFFFPPHEGQN